MTIKTKYSLGDKAWIMRDNKIVEVKISCIYVSFDEIRSSIVYHARKLKKSKNMYDFTQLKDSDLFDTKEVLVQSL